jgi:arginine decarboxylase
MRSLDTPEVHGYRPDLGYRVYTDKALEISATTRSAPPPEPSGPTAAAPSGPTAAAPSGPNAAKPSGPKAAAPGAR